MAEESNSKATPCITTASSPLPGSSLEVTVSFLPPARFQAGICSAELPASLQTRLHVWDRANRRKLQHPTRSRGAGRSAPHRAKSTRTPQCNPKDMNKKRGHPAVEGTARAFQVCLRSPFPSLGLQQPCSHSPREGQPAPSKLSHCAHKEHETDAGKLQHTCPAHQPWWLGAPAPPPADPEETKGAVSSVTEDPEPALPIVAPTLSKFVPLFSR